MGVLRFGLDYSAEPPGSVAIKNAGRDFVVRYAVNDWRGLKQYEKDDLTANGVDIAMVYESYEARITEGYAAGAYDATYAHSVVVARGLSPLMPIYFAVDYDMPDSDIPAFLQYLQGAGSVIGPARVGVYGGYAAIDAAARTGIKWLWQTSAWEYGRGLHAGALLYQHGYNFYVGGTNCDKTDAYAVNFGQSALATDNEPNVPDVVEPSFPKPDLPDFYDRVNGQRHPSIFVYKGHKFYPVRAKVVCNDDRTLVRVKPSTKAERAGEDILRGNKIAVDWIMKNSQGQQWLVNGDGYHFGGKFDPQLFIPKKRGEPVELVYTEAA